jgi:hypothetical protein
MTTSCTCAVAAAVALAGLASAAENAPAVFLNHFYVVVDSGAYAAVQASAFLTRDFAPFERRTTKRNDTSYTGVYWYGQRTYFELFEPGAQGLAGTSGLALGVEEPGASAALKRAWEALGETSGGPVTRRTETDEVPWFEMTYAREIPGLRVFLLEYNRDFLARWYGSLTPARSITRADVLDRYVARIGRSGDRDGTLLEDVTGLTIALAPESRDALVRQLVAVGWTTHSELADVVCVGPERVELRLAELAGRDAGIVEAAFSLRRPVDPAARQLGSAELRIDGRAARLRFRQ